ncbi:LysR family transcriptional regulator [Pseudooceanicola sp. CBS1P-1]|uniref:LysR family transcriptional regulator n=1 Tax=Pseudooceanicola albus TaxID=2692189 RepID=A0A6L7G6C9_9RHOB|nr:MULTISPECIES: LysR family transcriptional regulator [Pseudooceanicola]MBT9383044.1 LysR family transcriptional regulator [Pseudooceanicola endophyticus]MXN19232.1 LysR family transcriptional regulator [Pseudooceanicola albus]
MTLDQIRIFLAVAERQHVTRAAEALNMTQSAVSSALRALETRHGLRLFDRVGRRIELTEAGRRFLDTARALEAQAETAELVLRDLAGEAGGRLRLMASQTAGSYWLPSRLVALHARHPGVEITLRLGNSAQVAEAVQEGRADLGIVEGAVAQGDLTTRVVARDELVLVTAPDHPLATGPVSARDYLAQDWLLREPGSGTRAVQEAHLAQLGLSVADLPVAMILESNEAILSAVAAGGYASLLSSRVPVPGLKARPVTWAEPPRRDFSVLVHPQRYRSRAVVALLELLSAS